MVIIRYCVVEHLLLSKGIAHNDEDLHHAETVVAKDLLSPHILKVVFDLAIGMFLVFFGTLRLKMAQVMSQMYLNIKFF